MYTITIDLNDGTQIVSQQIDTNMEAIEFREQLAADPAIQIKFSSAFAELGLIERVDVSGNHISDSELMPLSTYQHVIDFLGRSNL